MICSYSNIVQSVILDMEAMILVWKTFYIMYQHVRNKKLSLSPCYILQLQCANACDMGWCRMSKWPLGLMRVNTVNWTLSKCKWTVKVNSLDYYIFIVCKLYLCCDTTPWSRVSNAIINRRDCIVDLITDPLSGLDTWTPGPGTSDNWFLRWAVSCNFWLLTAGGQLQVSTKQGTNKCCSENWALSSHRTAARSRH